MRALMKFDVAGKVPAGATINSVSLTGWVSLTYPDTPGTLNVQLHKVLADWGAGTLSNGTGRMPGIPWDRATAGDATWLQSFYDSNTALNKWATPGGDFSATTSAVTGFGADGTSGTWSSNAQLVADVQGWLNNPAANFGWLLKSDEIQDIGIYIDSAEATNAAHRPTLTIDYTAAAPSLAIAATDAVKAEGNSGSTAFTFTVTRSGDTSGTSSVNYAVTGSGASAASAADFAGSAFPSGSVTFNANETSKVVTVNVNGDTTVELDEGFTVTLASPVGATVATATATGTINNDDGAVSGITLTDGVLHVNGTSGSDRVSVELRSRGQIWIVASFTGSRSDGDDDDDNRNSRPSGVGFSLDSVKRIEMRLSDGNDIVAVSNSIKVPLLIDGGNGNDILRGGSGDDILLGGAGNDKLSGAGGRNILVGGDGNDELDGGYDRSILIGGNGLDRLKGSAKDDILIGGRSAYDANEVALMSILSEWTSTRPLATRISNLSTGVGAGNSYRLKLGDTVFDDGVRDTLYGGAGSDWFLAFGTDKISDRGWKDR
jgi:Ca2+-binding RTX toxin-like protein